MNDRKEREMAAVNAAAACSALTRRDAEEAEKGWRRIPFIDLIDAFGLIEPKEDPETHFHMRILWQWEREGYVPPISMGTLRRHGLPGAFGKYLSGGDSEAFSAYTLKTDVISHDWFDRWRRKGEGAVLGRALVNGTIDSLEALSSYTVLVPPMEEQERICRNLKRDEEWQKTETVEWWRRGLVDFPKSPEEIASDEEDAEWERELEEIRKEAERNEKNR